MILPVPLGLAPGDIVAEDENDLEAVLLLENDLVRELEAVLELLLVLLAVHVAVEVFVSLRVGVVVDEKEIDGVCVEE